MFEKPPRTREPNRKKKSNVKTAIIMHDIFRAIDSYYSISTAFDFVGEWVCVCLWVHFHDLSNVEQNILDQLWKKVNSS